MASCDPPRFLLLLPPGPIPPTAHALQVAFETTISDVLREVVSHSSKASQAAILEIALACPHLVDSERTPRATLYGQTQSYLAAIYKLVCTVAAKNDINVEDADGVDVRVLLVSWSKDFEAKDNSDTDDQSYGPVVSLRTLAHSKRPWQYAFGVEGEAGEAMVKAFIAAKGSGQEISRVPSGPVLHTKQTSRESTTDATLENTHVQRNTTNILNPHVAVGGTFDHIHIGHKLLLTMTVFAVDADNANGTNDCSATIGITGDQLLKNKKHAEVLESWQDRYKSVMTYINAIIDFAPPETTSQRQVSTRDDPGPNGKSMDTAYPNGLVVKCTEIQDPFGPTITDEQISALVISGETRAGGKAVNDKRAEKQWKPLDIFEVEVLDAEEDSGDGAVKEGFDSKLSSTAIREKLAKKRQSSL